MKKSPVSKVITSGFKKSGDKQECLLERKKHTLIYHYIPSKALGLPWQLYILQ